jgi:ketosteroid isomerase-like protein
MRITLALLLVASVSASLAAQTPASRGTTPSAGIDALNAQLSDAYRRRDPQAYAALFTDTAAFEWPAVDVVRGRAALAGMGRAIWAAQRDVELRVRPSMRRVDARNAIEFGAFAQAWTDSAGVRRTEYGRYAASIVRQPDGRWLFDRWLGFEDSTRVTPRAP